MWVDEGKDGVGRLEVAEAVAVPDSLDARQSSVECWTLAQSASNVGRWHRQRSTSQRCLKVMLGILSWVKVWVKA